uniref:39S ribosomal protein L46, mitochondrial n=1 Tax=Hirondellea gigas TaxID=1518452 RepID=A0A2P2I3K0_9CRUS
MLRAQILSIIRTGTQRVLPAGLKVHSNVPEAASTSTPVRSEIQDFAPEPVPLGGKGIDGWQIMAAVCISRHPVLTPPLSLLEHTYSQYLNKMEFEQSIQCDFELQVIQDSARKMLGDDELDELDTSDDTRPALEQLDLWKQQQQKFEKIRNFACDVPSSSVGSSLTSQVVLVQKYQLGKEELWLLPQGPWKPGETLRQTSERIVSEFCDPSLTVKIIGNAPVGFYKYKYPKGMRSNGYIGAKVFFYRGHVSNRIKRALQLLTSKGKDDQLWLTHTQIRDLLKQSYVKAITQFLIDDS